MKIVQIAPFISPGKGIAGVAWNLHRAFLAAGVDSELFTFDRAWGSRRLPTSRFALGRRALRAYRVIWFSTVGTRRARAFLAERPDAASICHSEALVGDVFVSHGVNSLALQTRRRGWWRLALNPVRAWTYLRDRQRFRSHIHRVVVTLSESETRMLTSSYAPIGPEVVEFPNGVDTETFHPPTAEERAAARAAFLLPDEARVALLVGHDLIRKGVMTAIEALVHAPSVLLLVVGGDGQSVTPASARAAELGVSERVHFAGPRSDIPFVMAASDMFVFPSRYEANALVILEALACGLPVVCTPVGYAPEIIRDGENGWLVPQDPRAVGERLEALASSDTTALRERARASIEGFGWDAVAQRYLDLLARVRPDLTGAP